MAVNTFNRQLAYMCVLGLGALVHAAAIAQDSTAESEPAEDALDLDRVSVTGTFVRGVAPVGTNVVDISRTDITAQGAVSTNDLMATIPQISNFNTLPRGGAGFGQPIVQTNLRNLGASGGTTTLVLMNNHRLVGAGILQTYVDPSIIPPGVIERVEVIPDGGSSIYGSDAIGGVINFITRRDFDGTAVNIRHGWADHYTTLDFDFTIGAAWAGGSAVLSYAYVDHDNVLGIDRDYNRQDHTSRGGSDFRTSACAPGNVQIDGVFHALPGLQPETVNRCDGNDYVDLYPQETRHSLFATVHHALTPQLELSADAYHSIRETTVRSAQFSSNVNITSDNPYFQSVNGETAHMVSFSYRDAFGDSSLALQRFVSTGLIPGLTWRGDNWQVKGTLNLGRSSNKINEHILNVAEENAAIAATSIETALNPYDPAGSNRAVLDRINNFWDRFSADQSIRNARVVADGTLFKISGGEVKAAIGAEYHREGLKAWIISGPDGAPLTASSNVSRHANSIFGELVVPLVGADNARPGLYALSLTVSARHDDYSDVGSTTNPKIGFSYSPFLGLTLRGNMGSSFHAPSLADTVDTVDSRLTNLGTGTFRWFPEGTSLADSLRPRLLVSGGNPQLKPEEADTWSFGFDFQPASIDGLSLSATYFNIDFSNVITVAPAFSGTGFFSNPGYSSFWKENPSIDEVRAMAGNIRLENMTSLEELFATNPPFLIYDLSRNNLSSVKMSGIDFNTTYFHPVGSGMVTANLGGTYVLKRKTKTIADAASNDDLKNGTGRLNGLISLGVEFDHLVLRGTYAYRDGYPVLGLTNQTRVGSFRVVDLFAGYTLAGNGFTDGLQLTLNLDNIFDEDPPFINNPNGFVNGSTLGRLIMVGLRKTF